MNEKDLNIIDRDKVIKKVGTSLGLIFNKEEQKLFNLEVGKAVSVTVKSKGGKK